MSKKKSLTALIIVVALGAGLIYLFYNWSQVKDYLARKREQVSSLTDSSGGGSGGQGSNTSTTTPPATTTSSDPAVLSGATSTLPQPVLDLLEAAILEELFNENVEPAEPVNIPGLG